MAHAVVIGDHPHGQRVIPPLKWEMASKIQTTTNGLVCCLKCRVPHIANNSHHCKARKRLTVKGR